jgi:hypothetical protein
MSIKDDVSYYKHLYKEITGAYPKLSLVNDFAKLSQDKRSGICWDSANFRHFTVSKEDKQKKKNTLAIYGKFTAKFLK